MTGRWTLPHGDFFSSVPAGDLYLLKRILHDWNDDDSATILHNCRRSMTPGGRVLVIDAVVPPGNLPHQSKTTDLMMTASLTGKERTAKDFTPGSSQRPDCTCDASRRHRPCCPSSRQ
ncbi:methyltransferase [Streptomyces sp. NPDC015144]|uniref:methyltransferase n=1 Tax=Streptomyces sp. NPDC015144 TaxID=3364944 RepID=UPI0036FD3D14